MALPACPSHVGCLPAGRRIAGLHAQRLAIQSTTASRLKAEAARPLDASMREEHPADGRRFKLSPFVRKLVLTIHIIVSVGLLGDSAGYLAVAIRAATTDDPLLAHTSYQLLQMFAFVFGIPLSFASLLTGVLLGLGTGWGVFRYPWVTAKLLLIVSVMAVGGLVLSGGMNAMVTGQGGAEGRLISGAAYDVVALTVATALGVFKPGKRWSFSRSERDRAAPGAAESPATPTR